jgi:predicted nucleic acid-binding protein
MVMTAAEPLFVDTNVLLYANVTAAPLHEASLDALREAYQVGRPLWISRQILREFIAVRTRPQLFTQPSSEITVIERIQHFEDHFEVADETLAVTEKLLELFKAYKFSGKQVHDANIVATMLTYDVSCLLTHNTKDFERFSDLITIEKIATI